MKAKEFLVPGKYYHIYNCGINGCDIFRNTDDYERFIRLLEKYISPVCEIYAWVLMKNHFHFMVKIKKNLQYKYSNEDNSFDKEKFNDIKWETIESGIPQSLTGPHSSDADRFEKQLIPKAYKHFSHLFNAYAKYYNIKYKRHGSLFERQFKRKEIGNIRYFKALVIYIHRNPVRHGFCKHPLDYGWSSYLSIISFNPSKLNREKVLGWFDDKANFKHLHDKGIEVEDIEKYLEL